MAVPPRTFGSFIRAFTAVVALFGFLFSSLGPAFAAGGQTGSLQGVAVDASTRTPISGATVTAVSPSGRYSAKTDARGAFSIINLSIDTYTIAIAQPGYETLTLSGVNIVGDNTVNLQTQALTKSLQTIGKTTARSRSSAFQPTQTVDSVTVSGGRATEALGKNLNTNESALALSVPGVQLTNGGRLTVRGGLSTEVGYQLDGIDFTEPFLFGNASNGISVGSASLQVVEGAGDATQGNIGGGVVNSVLKRGTNPAFGLLDLEIGAPNFNHQAGLEYGFATPDGKISDYITYVGQRYAPYYGSFSTNQTLVGNYDAISQSVADDFVNNFVLRFGRGNNQSLQVAYLNHDLQNYGDLSGVAGRLPQNYNPYNLSQLPAGTGDPTLPVGDPASAAFISARYGAIPFFSTADQSPTSPELIGFNPTRYLKFEYTNSLNPTTFLDISTANVQQLRGSSSWYDYASGGTYAVTGGQNTTIKAEITHQFGSENTTTLGFNLDNKHPLWNDYDPFVSALLLEAFAGSGTEPSTDEYALPANTGAPISAANPCPVAGAAGCYLYAQTGYTGRLPLFGINYNGTDNQEYGFYLRDQFNPTSKLHLDLGVRYDGLNWKQGANPFNPQPGALFNPDDVPVGIGPGNPPNFLRDNVVHPKFAEPRLAAAYQISNVDSVRAGYGRSVIFPNAQSLGTPMYISGLPSNVLNLAPLPGTNTADPSTWTCGATNPQWAASQSSANYNGGGSYFRCKTYGQQVYWALDQNFDAPDVGNNQPQTTSNTDLTYQHQFHNGTSLKLTTYYKREFAVPAFAIISQVLNAQGVPISQVFGVNNVGLNKTSGVELGLQSPDRPSGFTGYVSATYTNVIDSVPPLVASEDALPLIPTPSLNLGDTYRAGYVSPFVVNVGLQFKTKSGFRINPVLSYDRGFPIGVGNLIASDNPFGGFANLPQSNLNPPTLSGYTGITGAFNATNYVDPVNPGTITNPNIAATRGTPETSAAGGILSHPRLNANITFEFTRARNTFGLLIQNVFGNPYGEPIPNPYYQPVATGIAGSQTGQTNAAIPGSLTNQYGGFQNIPTSIYGHSAYILPLGQIGSNTSLPLTLRAYYQLSL